MPVFETGAFNHSATCPAACQVIGEGYLLQPARAQPFLNEAPSSQRGAPLQSEEFLQQRRALFCKYTRFHFRTVVEAGMAKQISD